MTNPCDMPYKLPRRRTFEILTDVLMDISGMKVRKMWFIRVKAHDAFDAFAVAPKAMLYRGEPYVTEIK